MTTAAKLYGKDLSVYDDMDVDTLLSQLTPEEISLLAKEVDPDVSAHLCIIYLEFDPEHFYLHIMPYSAAP